MKTLEDAWDWYVGARNQFRLIGRLARRHWERLPWEDVLARDDHFRLLDRQEVVAESEAALSELDGLAILVLFSVFESIVRDVVADDMRIEVVGLRHVAIRHAAREAIQRVEEGSLYWVLGSFKAIDPDLVEEVNQVRRYRNWVAHGRRGKAPIPISPSAALNRLGRFLEVLRLQSDQDRDLAPPRGAIDD